MTVPRGFNQFQPDMELEFPLELPFEDSVGIITGVIPSAGFSQVLCIGFENVCLLKEVY